MADGIRWVGLDVHARESTFAIVDQDSGEVITKRGWPSPRAVAVAARCAAAGADGL
jgi:hypothetical protein